MPRQLLRLEEGIKQNCLRELIIFGLSKLASYSTGKREKGRTSSIIQKLALPHTDLTHKK